MFSFRVLDRKECEAVNKKISEEIGKIMKFVPSINTGLLGVAGSALNGPIEASTSTNSPFRRDGEL